MPHRPSTKPDSASVSSPHDRLVKGALGRPEVFREFLFAALPGINERLHGLRRESEHFVDARLREHVTDLLFSGRIDDQPVRIYFLFEHRTRAGRFARKDLLRYLDRAYEQAMKSVESVGKNQRLSLIVPILLYAGKRPWNYPAQFAELVAVPAGLERFAIRFEHVLVDLSQVNLEAMKLAVSVRMTLGALQAAARGRVMEWFTENAQPWEEMLREESRVGIAELILRYCFECDESKSPSTIHQLAANVKSVATRKRIMSLADQLIQKGREEGLERGLERGLEQGLEKGREEGLEQGLEKGALIGRIQTFQDLLNESATSREKLARLSLPELQRMARKLQSDLQRNR